MITYKLHQLLSPCFVYLVNSKPIPLEELIISQFLGEKGEYPLFNEPELILTLGRTVDNRIVKIQIRFSVVGN